MRYRFLRFPEGKEKAVTLSYDDGTCYDIRFASICNKFGMKCTFNINSSFISPVLGESSLSAEEIQRYLLDAGHETAIHGRYHSAPGMCRPVDVIQEFMACRQELERMFHCIIRGCAYPDSGIKHVQNGTQPEHIGSILKDLDIAYARTAGDDIHNFSLPRNWYNWQPTCHHDDPAVFDYANRFVSDPADPYIANHWPKLFYLWGHSNEFYYNNNWEHIEKLCEILGGKADIWYATNIEIHDYVNAFESLMFNTDNTMVYNPTLMKVWFYQDGEIYMVAPGGTIEISNKDSFE